MISQIWEAKQGKTWQIHKGYLLEGFTLSKLR